MWKKNELKMSWTFSKVLQDNELQNGVGHAITGRLLTQTLLFSEGLSLAAKDSKTDRQTERPPTIDYDVLDRVWRDWVNFRRQMLVTVRPTDERDGLTTDRLIIIAVSVSRSHCSQSNLLRPRTAAGKQIISYPEQNKTKRSTLVCLSCGCSMSERFAV